MASTWNPSDKDTAITLSSGNMIATTNSTTETGVRGNGPNSTGKLYCEFTSQAAMGTAFGVGFANSSWSFTNNNGIGGDANSVAWATTGTVYYNNASIGTAAGATASGTVIAMCVDLGAQLVWFRLGGGFWNNSATALPATGIGGFSFSGIGAGPYFPAYGDVGTTGDSVMWDGNAPFVYGPPLGFVQWDSAAIYDASQFQSYTADMPIWRIGIIGY